MGPEHWWSWVVLAVVLGGPWLAAIAWVRRVTWQDDAVPESWGEYLRRRSSIG